MPNLLIALISIKYSQGRVFMKISFFFVVFVLFILTITGCSPNDTQFSREMPKDIELTNKVREEIGIRKIKNDIWYFYAKQISGNHTWDAWKYDEKGMACKHVEYDNEGDIIWEEDFNVYD